MSQDEIKYPAGAVPPQAQQAPQQQYQQAPQAPQQQYQQAPQAPQQQYQQAPQAPQQQYQQAPQQQYQQAPQPGVTPPLPQAALEAMQGAISERGGVNFSDVTYFKPTKPAAVGASATSSIRLLWSWRGEQDTTFWHNHYRHFCNVTVGGGRALRLPRGCPARNNVPPKPCPICERLDRAKAAGDDSTAAALKVSNQFLVNVIDLEHLDSHFSTDASGQPVVRSKVFGLSQKLFTSITHLLAERGQVYHREFGRDLKVITLRKGMEAKEIRYSVMDASNVSALPPGFENIQLLPLDQIEPDKDYAALAREISQTYPDAPLRSPSNGGAPAYPNPNAQQAPQQQYQQAPQQSPPYQPPQQPSSPQQAPQQATQSFGQSFGDDDIPF